MNLTAQEQHEDRIKSALALRFCRREIANRQYELRHGVTKTGQPVTVCEKTLRERIEALQALRSRFMAELLLGSRVTRADIAEEEAKPLKPRPASLGFKPEGRTL